ncbi:response regulator transcription factor [soil metagenome]
MAGLLEQALRESGFEVVVASNGRDGLSLAVDRDALIVDVMMPVMNGFEMVRQLRSSGSRVPVLFLTAKDAVADRVKGLEIGGDDYLLKPFALEELLARVRALLRRARDTQDVLEYADLWLDRRERKARRGDEWLFLSNTEFALLETFLLSPETPLPKTTLLREVWHDDAARDDNIVEVYVSYLRSKTEARGRTRLLHTVRGAGYILQSRED